MDSPEYKALNQCYPTLVSGVQQSPNDIAVQLRPSGILSPGDLQYLNNPSHDADEKARRLLNTVLTQVEINSKVYHTFTAALRAAGPWTNTALSKLESTYVTMSTSIAGASSSTDSSHQRGEALTIPIKTDQSTSKAFKKKITKSVQAPKPWLRGSARPFNESQMFKMYVSSDSLCDLWTEVQYHASKLRDKSSACYPSLVQICNESAQTNSSEIVSQLRIYSRALQTICQEVTKCIETSTIGALLVELAGQQTCKQQLVDTLVVALSDTRNLLKTCKLGLEQSFLTVKELEAEQKKEKNRFTCRTIVPLSAATLVTGAAVGLIAGLQAAVIGSVVVLVVGVAGSQLLVRKDQGSDSQAELVDLCYNHINDIRGNVVVMNNLLDKIMSILS